VHRWQRETFKKTRCIVAADGFYEWTGPKGDKSPHFFQPAQPGLLRMAGIWEEGEDGVRHFVVLTTQANDFIGKVHTRMPVLLAPDDVDAWLRGSVDQARQLMLPAAEDALRVTALQKHVNNVRNDGPECHEPA
jgi:putative SOS response-associated peptidase YedK